MRDGLRDDALIAALIRHKALPGEELERRVREEWGGCRIYIKKSAAPGRSESRRARSTPPVDTDVA